MKNLIDLVMCVFIVALLQSMGYGIFDIEFWLLIIAIVVLAINGFIEGHSHINKN